MASPAAETETGPDHAAPITRSDLQTELASCFLKLEATMTEKITALMAPLTAQLQELQQTVPQVAQTADSSMELGLMNQDTTQQLQKNQDWAAEKILMLENQLKMANLKLRGFPEGSEENQDLIVFISTWLATQLQLEDGVAPTLLAAYRLGPPRRAPNSLPRDILIKCLDSRTKQKFLTTSRAKGHLMFHNYKIVILQDLSAETLEARRRLKPLTTLLLKEKIRYRWHAYTKVQIIYKGVPLTADDFGSATKMLSHLGLDIPEEFLDPDSPEDQGHWQKAR